MRQVKRDFGVEARPVILIIWNGFVYQAKIRAPHAHNEQVIAWRHSCGGKGMTSLRRYCAAEFPDHDVR